MPPENPKRIVNGFLKTLDFFLSTLFTDLWAHKFFICMFMYPNTCHGVNIPIKLVSGISYNMLYSACVAHPYRTTQIGTMKVLILSNIFLAVAVGMIKGY
jgi:hypothetical protein